MSGGGGGCSRFKQNAWKKEMCSNCYKTKDEHQDRPRPALPDLPLISPSQSILKGWDRDRKKKRKSVSFPMEECEVIGFGGEELSSEDEIDFEEIPSSREESSEEPDGDDDRALKKLTKTNTDFNSVLCNLTGNKPVQTMMLGNQKRDTIQVTVQPFSNNLANSRKIHLSKLLQDNAPSLTIIPCDKKEAEPPPKEVETRKVNITRGSVITKNHESVKNKLYIQNILNNKNEKRNSYSLDKVYITTNAKTSSEDKHENIEFVSNKSKNCVVLNCNGVSLLDVDSDKDRLLMESREMAGEPDGKADSDEAEIPVTPPPRISFLHRDNNDIKRVNEVIEAKRVCTVESQEIKRPVEPAERRIAPSPENRRLSETVQIRKRSESDSSRTFELKETASEIIEIRRNEPTERRIEIPERRIIDTADILRRIEPSIRRLSDTTDTRRNTDNVEERRFSDISEMWRDNDVIEVTKRHSVATEDTVRCTKRQAPKPPLSESESEVESEIKTESETSSSESCEKPILRIEKLETTPVPMRPVRPETLKISVSSEDTTSISSSPEPDKPENFYETRRTSPKREPPPLPPTTPEPRKSPPEPLPRHNKTSFIDVEKKKTKMKETIKKLLRLGTKEEMEVEVQSPRVRPQIIHPIDLNKSGVEVLPTANIIKCTTPETPSTPTPHSTPTCRPNKPPPPPRSESLNLMERLKSKPGSENNIYANLGEARSGMTPVKPVRTGSMREAAGKLTPVVVRDTAASSVKKSPENCNSVSQERITLSTVLSSNDPDNLYEAIGSANSAPECDMGQQTYYGSETESDTYSGTNFNETASRDGRRGRMVIPYLSIEENFTALSQLNHQAINHLLTKILERDKNGGDLSDYNLDMVSRREICKCAFVQAEKICKESVCKRVTLAVTPPEVSLILPHSLPFSARFTDSIPQELLPKQCYSIIGEVTVLCDGEVSRLTECHFDSEPDDNTERKIVLLLQVLQIISQISSRQCFFDNFILLRDSENQLAITYLHQASDKDVDWKTSVERLCNWFKIPEPLSQRLTTCQSDSEASLAVTSWLYGPPPSLSCESLQSWLTLQRAYALRSYLSSPDMAVTQHIIFLASNIDLNSLYNESCIIQQPSQ